MIGTKADKIVLKPEAEKALLELVKYRDRINNLTDEVLVRIGRAGKEINPNFKGVIGDKVRCVYRRYGAKYKYEWNKLDKLEPFIIHKDWTSVDAGAVDKYLEENGELPDGIYMP